MQTCWCPVGNKPAPAWHCNTFKHRDFTRSLLKCGICDSLFMYVLTFYTFLMSLWNLGKNSFSKTMFLPPWQSLLQAEYVICNCVCVCFCVLGIESILVGSSHPYCPCPFGLCAACSIAPAPAWWCAGLSEAQGSALHSQHRRHPHFPGRVYTWYQTTWCTHGSQPAGTCTNCSDTPKDKILQMLQSHFWRRMFPGSSIRRLLHPDDLSRAGTSGFTAATQACDVEPARGEQSIRGGVPLQRRGDGLSPDGRLALTHTCTHTQPEQEWDRAQPAAM